MTTAQLVAYIGARERVDRSAARRALKPALRELERSGAVVLGRGKRFFAAESTDLVGGTMRLGAGGWWVEPGVGDGEPVRIPPSGRRGAMVGDRVQVRLERARRQARELGRREGVVVRVLERARRTVVGRWVAGPGRPHIIPVDRGAGRSVMVSGSKLDQIPRDDELVMLELESGADRGQHAKGRLVERIGHIGEPGVVERAVLRAHAIPEEFPAAAEVEAEAFEPGIDPAELARRWDLRERPVITIDPETARDFDDAINAFEDPNGTVVVEVHIADVSHYVRPGTALDAAARERGTSVYLPGRCVAMLPERLSGDLCSLRGNEERFAMSVRFAVAPDGEVSRVETAASVIRSRRRCTYEEVAGWLELPSGEWPAETADFAPSLRLSAEAARRLGVARRERGSLDLGLAEPVVVLDDRGRVVGVRTAERNDAHRLVEELMVAANSAVAATLMQTGQPALHRVHDRPDGAKVEQLGQLLGELGINVPGGVGTLEPGDLQRILAVVNGLPAERLLTMMVLRTLARAVYSPEPRGHYALATDSYLHFTSPIRRYPDLVVHRMLRRLQDDGRALEGEERERVDKDLATVAASSTAAAQRAEAAERAAVKWLTILHLRDREGDVFGGHITGVTSFGLFVELDEVFVDGLVHIAELSDDYYDHDERRHRLVGERTGRTWRMGDPVKVRVVRVDVAAMLVQLAPIGVKPDPQAIRRSRDRAGPHRRRRR